MPFRPSPEPLALGHEQSTAWLRNMRSIANSTLFNGDGSPSLKSEKLSDSKEIQKWVGKYLDVGEFVMDQSVAALGATSWFERRR
jgi:hypothetical protein